MHSSDPHGLIQTIAEGVIEVAACRVSASKLLMNESVSLLSLYSFRDWALFVLSPERRMGVTGSSCILFASMVARLCSISTACVASQAGCLWQLLALVAK